MTQYLIIVLLGLSFIFILVVEYKHKSPFIIVWLALIVVFFIPHSGDIILGEFHYKSSTYEEASLFSLGFNLVYLFFRFFLLKKINILQYDPACETNAFILPYLEKLFFLVSGSFIGLIVFQGYSLMEVTWTERRLASGGITLILAYLWNIATVPIIYSLITRKYFKSAIFSIIFAIVILILRTRSFLVPVLFPFLIYAIYLPANFSKKIIGIAISSIIIIISVIVLIQIRYMGSLNEFVNSGATPILESSIYYITQKKGELSLRDGLYHFLEIENKFGALGQGVTYKRIAMLPLASSFSAGLKPPDLMYDMALAMGAQLNGASFHPTLYGDAYANFGWLGFLLGSFYAFVASGLDCILQWSRRWKIQLLLLSPFCYLYVFVARGSVYNGFAVAFWCCMFIILITSVFKRSEDENSYQNYESKFNQT
jgi:hypothetical protein